MNIEEIRSKTKSELAFEMKNMKKELFDLRFKAAIDVSPNPARIQVIRRSIARIKTVLHEREQGIRGQEVR